MAYFRWFYRQYEWLESLLKSLILNGYDHHQVFHSKDEFARGKCHVNGIENFWSFAKSRVAKFNSCSSDAFVLHSKECEFRYNHRNDDLFKIIKQIFKRC
jgi:IS1016 family transposase